MTVMISNGEDWAGALGQIVRHGLEPTLPGPSNRPILLTPPSQNGAPPADENGEPPPLPGDDGNGGVIQVEEGWFTRADGSIKWMPVTAGAAVLIGLYFVLK